MSHGPAIVLTLTARRVQFKRFVTARVGNEAEAEDLLQSGLLKALLRAPDIKDEEKLVGWFYQVLRTAIVDLARSRGAARKRDAQWTAEALASHADPRGEQQLCACFESLLPGLKPAHADLIRRVDLNRDSVASAAGALGITPNHASVTLHRARAELREKLIHLCGDCACLDNCECEPTPPRD